MGLALGSTRIVTDDELVLLARQGDAEALREASEAIHALSPRLRDALLLGSSGEASYEEIASMLGIPVGTLKWRVSEARRKIKARLAAPGCVNG